MRVLPTWTSSWPLPALLLVLAAVASACAPDGLRYTLVPKGDPAETQAAVAVPAAPTGDRQLDAFLADFASAIDRGDWYSIARMLEGPAYAEQHDAAVASGDRPEAAAARLIAGAIGLASLEEMGAEPFSGLDRIQVVTLRTTTDLPTGVTRIQGDVRLDGGEVADLSAFVRLAPDLKRYRIILSRV
ncbi:MAG: hypothetical protein Rubg2KO_09320 [Rubricoccaceae bacterium]